MKKLFFPAFFLLFATSVRSQNNIQLHLSPRLGLAPFALNTPVTAGNYEYKISRLEYYISEIRIMHDGGQLTSVADLYLLVQPALESMYDLGAYPAVNQVEAITFSIGVDTAHNHSDPASYPANHPLAPQNPSMHWGWAAGYRFAAIEGVAGANFANIFEIHALGDANYKTLTIATAAENTPEGRVIHLVADYAKMLTNINVGGGLIVHGESGKAVTLLNNMKDLVFSAETSATVDPAFKGSFSISPNPVSTGDAMATMMLPSGFDYRLTLTDLTGTMVLNRQIAAGSQFFAFDNDLHAGVYFVNLWQNGFPVVTEKLVVAQ